MNGLESFSLKPPRRLTLLCRKLYSTFPSRSFQFTRRAQTPPTTAGAARTLRGHYDHCGGLSKQRDLIIYNFFGARDSCLILKPCIHAPSGCPDCATKQTYANAAVNTMVDFSDPPLQARQFLLPKCSTLNHAISPSVWHHHDASGTDRPATMVPLEIAEEVSRRQVEP